jgi:hypothetical protein
MAPLLFTCPTTQRRAPTCVETDPKSLAAAWKKVLKVECPHCGEVHAISVRQAYIAFAVHGTDPIVVDRSPGATPPRPKGFIPRRAPAVKAKNAIRSPSP